MRQRAPRSFVPVLLLAAGGGAVLLGGPAVADIPESRYVLVVAHNSSLDPGVKPLRFADDDGARYWELFSETRASVSLLSVMDPETARTHPVAAREARVPWLRELRESVARIGRQVRRDNRAGRRTTFTFIYVGHGNVGPDGEGYINLQDVRLRRRDLFSEVIDRVPAASVHLVIDACKSFFLLSRGPENWRDDRSGHSYGEEVRAFLARGTLAAHPQVGVILSTSGDEEVHEWSALRSGVFSHQLRSALSGGADINGDGKVEYSEVGAFIAAANFHVAHQRARIRPFIRPPAAERDAVLLDLRAGGRKVLLELDRTVQGRISVEDERGVRTADLNKPPGTELVLRLLKGHLYYIKNGEVESVLPQGRSGLVKLASLAAGPARAGSRGSVDQTFRDDLFGQPFTRSFYEGYLATSDLPSVSFSQSAPWVPQERVEPLTWCLDISYSLSPGVLELYGGLQHSVALGIRRSFDPLYVSLHLEAGMTDTEISSGGSTTSSSLVRLGLLAGVGLSWRPWWWAELALELDAGYQALILDEEQLFGDETDGARQATTSSGGAKLGSLLQLTLHPWRRLSRLGLTLRAGLFGHITRVQDRTATYALPEGGVGISYGF